MTNSLIDLKSFSSNDILQLIAEGVALKQFAEGVALKQFAEGVVLKQLAEGVDTKLTADAALKQSSADTLKAFSHGSTSKMQPFKQFSENAPQKFQSQQSYPAIKGYAGLLFFEPSTRTRFSFEAACVRAGIHPLVLDGSQGTSLEKGESLEDTILNIEAMRPLFFVIRAPDSLAIDQLTKMIKVPIINAGWGMRGHPTQALLDVMTLTEKWGDLSKKKILFLGDVRHSRVVRSHLELSEKLGYTVGYCCPEIFKPNVDQLSVPATGRLNTDSNAMHGVQFFSDLKEGLQWADAVVALRVQKERHTQKAEDNFIEEYRKNYGLNLERLKALKPEGMILHPGPINYGVELEKEVLSDPRSVVLRLVENGVFIREAVIRRCISKNGALHDNGF